MSDYEIVIGFEKKEGKKKIKIDKEKLDIDEGDRIKWKRTTKDDFPFTIFFPDQSPFRENEFKVEKGKDTGYLKLTYDPDQCGWRRFKYIITAFDGVNVLVLDPELIIPRNP